MNPETQNILTGLFQNTEIEDFHFSAKGVSTFSRGRWKTLSELSPFSEIDLDSLARKIAENVSAQMGLNIPALDSFFDFDATHRFRAHLIVSPLSVLGTEISLRRLNLSRDFKLDDFDWPEANTKHLVTDFYAKKKNFLICGSTGSGKTSFLKALLALSPIYHRIVILEDSPELFLERPLLSHLICRTQRFGSRPGAFWNLGHLVIESLRMRPDRLILGECRGSEASAIAQALFTGHSGILSTLHAGSAGEGLKRFTALAQMPHLDSSNWGWDAVIFLERGGEGNIRRRVREFLWIK
jgi:pilus assembly protein CpaF